MKMHEMSVMDEHGDTKVYWDPSNPESVLVASEAYALQITRGCRAFAMVNDTQGEIMDAFDPNVSSVVFVPPLQGG
jgi:hypothetical protein